MQKIRFPILAVIVLVSLSLFAEEELSVDLKFVPQELVDASSPGLAPPVLDRPLRLVVQDARSGDAWWIGEGTDDDDETFPILATTDVLPYLDATVHEVANDWGVQTSDRAERVLTLRVTRFAVEESNKPLGSTYTAEVKLTFTLAHRGRTLAEGAVSGSAHRYGRSRSADNCNEVLSDALKEALADALGNPRLQMAWAGRPSPGAGKAKEPADSIEQRLKRLNDLLRKGLITEEEYDRKREEILEEL